MLFSTRIRQSIRKFHLVFDGWIGQIFSDQPSLSKLVEAPNKHLTPDLFGNFYYSRLSHFSNFRILSCHRNQSPSTCDLKVYQDALVYTFITDNILPGSRLLEIGGGESRIISELKDQYELWNLDKLQGEGFGPLKLSSMDGFHLVADYIGEFSSKLPDGYFDLVYSISTLEHIPEDKSTIDAVIKDIQRLLKPEGYSLHCVDSLFYWDRYYVHNIIATLHQRGLLPFQEVDFNDLKTDPDLWLLSKYAFYTRWYPIVRQPIAKFGYPFSINVLWKKQ